MIQTLEEMKNFLSWCKDKGIVAVKFETTPATKSDGPWLLIPVDVILARTPPTVDDVLGDGPVRHSPFEEDGGLAGDPPDYSEGVVIEEKDLYGSSG